MDAITAWWSKLTQQSKTGVIIMAVGLGMFLLSNAIGPGIVRRPLDFNSIYYSGGLAVLILLSAVLICVGGVMYNMGSKQSKK
jgi:hypothetical protein